MYAGVCAEQLICLQTRLAEREQEMRNELQQLTTEHEMSVRRLQTSHDEQIERIRAGQQQSHISRSFHPVD